MACLVALNVSLRLHFYVLFLLGEQRLGNYEIRKHDWHLPVARSRPQTFSLEQYILCYTKYMHTFRVCDELQVKALVSFRFYG